jgi:hypothetical protein
MLMKKIHSQPRPSTSGPPISQAVVAPMPPSAPPDPEGLVAFGALLECGGNDRERARGHDRRPDPLEGASPDQRLVRPGEPAQERGEREEDDADHEHAAAPEQVGRPPAEQQQAGEGQGVGTNHPLQPLRREAELLLDRGDRNGHDRRIQDDHEERTTKQRQRPPAAGVGCGPVRQVVHVALLRLQCCYGADGRP